jgi:hypothetical protein
MGVEKIGCSVCGTPEEEHGFRKHPFTPPGEQLVLPQQESKKKSDAVPRLIITPAPDLVLRQVLLRKGLVTSEELEAMERELTIGVIGIQPAGKAPDVQSHESPNG